MAIYLFENPNNKEEIVEIVQSIHEKHEYIKDGIKWNRIFTVPNASIDSQLNPDNPQDFVKYTSSRKGTIGDLMDLSAELSNKRKDKKGIDPVKEKYYDKYAKDRKGTKHPDVRKRELKEKIKGNKFIKFED